MNIRKFAKIYENEIKIYRDDYYRNIITNNQNTTYSSPIITYIVPLTISIIPIIILGFSIKGYLLAILFQIISNLLIYILYKSKINKNEYLEAIKKHGYNNIEDYEKKLKEYITNPNGYYSVQLHEILEKYNINSSTKKIQTTNGEEYYIWSNKNKDKIYLLNTKTDRIPEPKIIPISNIRYFRLNNLNKELILKTNNEIYNFKEEYIVIFNELIKEKRLENIKIFDPGTHINDFEIYMSKIKKNLETDNYHKKENIQKNLQFSICIIITICILLLVSTFIPQTSLVLNIINIILLIPLNISLNEITNNIYKEQKKSDIEIIKLINSKKDCIEMFQELKYILGIKNTYDKVYTKEGAEYITWVANGYFHVFLNLIYFNSVYMAVKTSDVKYFKNEHNSCDIRLKDKTLTFTKESSQVFNKILPNKDYEWIKKSQNR